MSKKHHSNKGASTVGQEISDVAKAIRRNNSSEAVEEEVAETAEAVEESEAEAVEEEAAETAEAVEESEAEAVEEEAAETAEAVEESEAEAVEEEAAEAVEAVEESESEAVEEEIAEAVEAIEESESEAVEEEAAEAVEAVEESEAEAIEEEIAEAVEAVEESEAEAVEEEAAEAVEAVEESEAEAVEEEAAEAVEAVEAVEESESEAIEEVTEAAEVIEELETEAVEEEVDEAAELSELLEGETPEESDADLAEEVDEDDYLDYDEDVPRKARPKKKVSGRTAICAMLITALCTIAVIVGAFLVATEMKKDIGIKLVSYTDKVNACDTNAFSFGSMLGIAEVSYSDTESTLTAGDIKALSSGKTVTKFDGLVHLSADTRFGKIVSMDIVFDPALDETSSPSGYYMLLTGNLFSGFYDEIDTSDQAFMLAYSILNYAMPAPGDNENLFRYLIDQACIYMDYTTLNETGNLSDLKIHIENVAPDFLDTSKLDFTWLPWYGKNDDTDQKNNAVSSSLDVSGSDVSDSDL